MSEKSMNYTTLCGNPAGTPIQYSLSRPIRVKMISFYAATIPFTTPGDGQLSIVFGGGTGSDPIFDDGTSVTLAQTIFLRITDQSTNDTMQLDIVTNSILIDGLDQTYKFLTIGYELV